MHRLFAELGAEALKRHIHIMWIQFDPKAAPTSAFRSNQRRSRPSKSIQHDSSAPRAVPYGVLDKRYRFYSGMHGQFSVPCRAEGIDTSIISDICAITPEATQFHIVDMRRAAMLIDSDQLMPRAIERAHAAIGLGPDA